MNEQVRIQFGEIWKPARVIKQHNARSFSVQTRDGAIYRRNRRHLIKTQMNTPRVEPFNPKVLAQPAQPETATSLSSDTSVKQSYKYYISMPYITRSGREVKINKRYNDSNWITN